jgi:hypothetical protein
MSILDQIITEIDAVRERKDDSIELEYGKVLGLDEALDIIDRIRYHKLDEDQPSWNGNLIGP